MLTLARSYVNVDSNYFVMYSVIVFAARTDGSKCWLTRGKIVGQIPTATRCAYPVAKDRRGVYRYKFVIF